VSLLLLVGSASTGPWETPLMVARSTDGVQFDDPTVFQDSSGVPSVVQWKGDTLACVFQWCRLPMGGPTWDRVAVKFSFDRGSTWTEPQRILINGLPPSYQRPFDPTLAVVAGQDLRIYFSSSDGMPPPGGDSIIDTYSAVSTDGVNYTFEPGPRVNHPTSRVIDPAVIWFRGGWHYVSPIGAPQDGAYHYVSPDGLHFSRVPDIRSDPAHNWTGNFVVNDTNDLRFYGCGPNIWFNSSPDGGNWLGYTPTNVRGGDPSVVKLGANDYLMVYVGQPYAGVANADAGIRCTPRTAELVRGVLQMAKGERRTASGELLDAAGRKVMELVPGPNDVRHLASGVYFVVARHGVLPPGRIVVTR
jgi:hypothetical protein